MKLSRIILETDGSAIAEKVSGNASAGGPLLSDQVQDTPDARNHASCPVLVRGRLSSACLLQTITQALATAREHLARSLLK